MNTKFIRLSEHEELPTSCFKYAKFPFEKFNVVQSGLIDVVEKDINCIVAASTGVGKTLCAELFAAHTIRKLNKKVIYLSPLKSLSQERYDDWMDKSHHFSDRKISICTGDYRMTPQRKKELQDSDIIIFTSEMLNSLGRNYNSEKNQFLADVGTVVVDESHALGSENRGAHLESGIMKFTEYNPDARLIMLSATMPNVDEVSQWLSKLNGKTTCLLQSPYRQCELNIHYERYWDMGYGYKHNEEQKIELAIKLVKKYPHDKFICFVHTKDTGKQLLARLNYMGIDCGEHNGNLEKAERIKIEKRFREDPKLRVIVATSTLSQGLNLPARRVIVVGLHRGLSEVSTAEIQQECGRAGRPKFDKEGDAHILVPSKRFDEHVERLKQPQYIQSQMNDPKILAFHLVSEIHHRTIYNIQGIKDWYKRTFAHFQNKSLDEDVIQNVINGLVASGCIKNEDGELKTTATGTVASMFYFSPFDAADLNKNFTRLFDNSLADSDIAVCMALANIDSNRQTIVNTAEKAEMEEFVAIVSKKINNILAPKQDFTSGTYKIAYCYYLLLQGKHSAIMSNTMRGLHMDFGRTGEVLSALDSMSGKWDENEFLNTLKLRVTYGVEPELVDLCKIVGIGRVKAKRLYAAGLRNPKEIVDVEKVIKALGCSKKIAQETIKLAKKANDEI